MKSPKSYQEFIETIDDKNLFIELLDSNKEYTAFLSRLNRIKVNSKNPKDAWLNYCAYIVFNTAISMSSKCEIGLLCYQYVLSFIHNDFRKELILIINDYKIKTGMDLPGRGDIKGIISDRNLPKNTKELSSIISYIYKRHGYKQYDADMDIYTFLHNIFEPAEGTTGDSDILLADVLIFTNALSVLICEDYFTKWIRPNVHVHYYVKMFNSLSLLFAEIFQPQLKNDISPPNFIK